MTDYLADHGFPYDLMSVMHYRQFAFSKNRQPTIMPRRPVPHLRCRGSDCPSDLDVRKINYLYKCKDGKSGFKGKTDEWGFSSAYEGNSKKKKKPRKKKKKKSGYGKRGYGGNEYGFGDGYDLDNFIVGNPFYETLPVRPDYRPARPKDEELYESDPRYGRHLAYAPYESRQSTAVQSVPPNPGLSSAFSWVSNLFHW